MVIKKLNIFTKVRAKPLILEILQSFLWTLAEVVQNSLYAINTRYIGKSIEVGAARLFESFHKHEPIIPDEIEAIESHLDSVLAQVVKKAEAFEIETLIGSSGAFTSFAKIIAHRLNESEKITYSSEYTFDLNEFQQISDHIIDLTLEERYGIPGLINERAPMIVVGTILVNYILKKLHIQHFKLARYALKEGVASDFLKSLTN